MGRTEYMEQGTVEVRWYDGRKPQLLKLQNYIHKKIKCKLIPRIQVIVQSQQVCLVSKYLKIYERYEKLWSSYDNQYDYFLEVSQ